MENMPFTSMPEELVDPSHGHKYSCHPGDFPTESPFWEVWSMGISHLAGWRLPTALTLETLQTPPSLIRAEFQNLFNELAYGITSYNIRGLTLDGWMPSSLFQRIAEAVHCAPPCWTQALLLAVPAMPNPHHGREIIYPLLQVVHCNYCNEQQSSFFLCRLTPQLLPLGTNLKSPGAITPNPMAPANVPNAAFQMGIDFSIPTSYPFVYSGAGISDLASTVVSGTQKYMPIPYSNMLYHLKAEHPGWILATTAWSRPCLALPSRSRGWGAWIREYADHFAPPVELLGNVVLALGEQSTLLHLLDPLRLALKMLYKEDTLGAAAFNGWIPSSLFYDVIERVIEDTGPSIIRGLSTNLYDPEPTEVAIHQIWQVPLIQCFVYKRVGKEYHMARLHPLLRDPVGVKQEGYDDYYLVTEDFFF